MILTVQTINFSHTTCRGGQAISFLLCKNATHSTLDALSRDNVLWPADIVALSPMPSSDLVTS